MSTFWNEYYDRWNEYISANLKKIVTESDRVNDHGFDEEDDYYPSDIATAVEVDGRKENCFNCSTKEWYLGLLGLGRRGRITGGGAKVEATYGDRGFSSSLLGYAASLVKSMYRELKKRCRAHLVHEFRTSRICLLCEGLFEGCQ
nr:5800_t:CDS:2 [Entrophospora candida]